MTRPPRLSTCNGYAWCFLGLSIVLAFECGCSGLPDAYGGEVCRPAVVARGFVGAQAYNGAHNVLNDPYNVVNPFYNNNATDLYVARVGADLEAEAVGTAKYRASDEWQAHVSKIAQLEKELSDARGFERGVKWQAKVVKEPNPPAAPPAGSFDAARDKWLTANPMPPDQNSAAYVDWWTKWQSWKDKYNATSAPAPTPMVGSGPLPPAEPTVPADPKPTITTGPQPPQKTPAEVAAWQDELKSHSKEKGGYVDLSTGKWVSDPDNPKPDPRPHVSLGDLPPYTAAPPASAADWSATHPTMAATCSKCHSGSNPKGNFWIDGTTDLDSPDAAEKRDKIVDAIRAGLMPKTLEAGHRLPDDKLKAIEDELYRVQEAPTTADAPAAMERPY